MSAIQVGVINGKARLNDAKVAEMRLAVRERRCTIRAVARRFGVDKKTAGNAVYGYTWKHVPEPPATPRRFKP